MYAGSKLRYRSLDGVLGNGMAHSPRVNAFLLVTYAVGEDPPVWRKGLAKRVKAGSKFLFNAHYTTNGTPGRDRSKLALVFAKGPIENEIHSAWINNGSFEIPPYVAFDSSKTPQFEDVSVQLPPTYEVGFLRRQLFDLRAVQLDRMRGSRSVSW